MRKLYTFLASALMLLAGASPASADGGPVEDGYYFLQNAAYRFLDANGNPVRNEGACVYVTGTVARYNKDGYFPGNTLAGTDLAYIWRVERVDGVENGYRFTSYLTGGQMVDDNYATSATVNVVPDGAGTFIIKTWGDGSEGDNVFAISGESQQSGNPIRGLHTQVSDGGLVYWDETAMGSAWELVPADVSSVTDEVKINAQLIYVRDQYFPNGQQVSDVFVEGDNFGQVPSEYYQRLFNAYSVIEGLINYPEGVTQEEADAAAKELKEAYEAAKANIVSVTDGYYFIHDSRTPNKYLYGRNGKVYNTANFSLPYQEDGETIDETQLTPDAHGRYIWYVERTEEGKFYIQNFFSSDYVLHAAANTQYSLVAKEDATAWVISQSNSDAGGFNIGLDDWTGLWNTYSSGIVSTWNDKKDYGNAMQFQAVSDDVINSLEAAVKQQKLREDIVALAGQAEEELAAASKREEYVTAAEQLWSNAVEPNEGSIANALDGSYTTYFHSTWSSAPEGIGEEETAYHTFGADLGQALEKVNITITKRVGANNDCSPLVAHLYVANELTDEDKLDQTSSAWTQLDDITFIYDQNITVDGTTRENWKGTTPVSFGGAYRYVLFEVVETPSMQTTNQNLHFNFSEIRYEGDFDEFTSPILAVPAEVVTELENSIKDARAAVEEETYTQETYDRLETALEAFRDNLPDPTALKELIEEAKNLAQNAVEGDELGYFKEGAADALLAAANTAEGGIKDLMTVVEINKLTKDLRDALAAFNGKLNKPVDGKWYRIRSLNQVGNFLAAPSTDEATIVWSNANYQDNLNYLWKAIVNEDGTYSFQNAFSGLYMGTNNQKWSADIKMTAEPASIMLEFSGQAGAFNLTQEEGIYANTDPRGILVTWLERGSNSLFEFVDNDDASDVDSWAGYQVINSGDTYAHIYVMPFAIASAYQAQLYLVLGSKDQKLQLAETEAVEAGQAFIAVAESESFYVELPVNEVEDVEVVAEPKAAENGLVGVFTATTISDNDAILRNDVVSLPAVANQKAIAANGGYIDLAAVPATDVDGDLSLDFSDGIISGIAQAIATNGNKAIYDLTGRRVQKAQSGLYIINGKKVLVK